MTPVKVWQERVEIPTYETGPQDIHPMFLENRVYQGSSGAVYPYGRDRYAERAENPEILAGGCGWENDYIKVMILPETGRSGASRMG
ncbi:TPR repeat-containing protein [Escherichia coli]|uniref:TPR repeat-containing protein n=1 Tax=Escherichia coli TaxID=562 RepID=A0A376SC35_ECOLX|nr:TPR repeat-containing protein [Escherichia coli]